MANLPVPSPRTFGVGEFETGSYLNSVRDGLSFLVSPPFAVAYQITTQSIATATPTALALDGTLVDPYGSHSTSSNNSRITAQVAGSCLVKAGVVWAANNTGNRGLQIYKNGVAWPYSWQVNLAAGTFNDAGIETMAIVTLTAGDYIEAWAQQTSGGALSTAVATSIASNLQAYWIHS